MILGAIFTLHPGPPVASVDRKAFLHNIGSMSDLVTANNDPVTSDDWLNEFVEIPDDPSAQSSSKPRGANRKRRAKQGAEEATSSDQAVMRGLVENLVDKTNASSGATSGSRTTLKTCNVDGLTTGQNAACFVVDTPSGLYGTARDCSARAISALEEIGQAVYREALATEQIGTGWMYERLKEHLGADRRTQDVSLADEPQQRSKFVKGLSSIPQKRASTMLWHARSEVNSALKDTFPDETFGPTTFPILLPIDPRSRSTVPSEGGLQLLDIPDAPLPMTVPDTPLGISSNHKKRKQGSQNTLTNISTLPQAVWTVHRPSSSGPYYASARLKSCSDAQISQFTEAFQSILGLEADCSANQNHSPQERETTCQCLMDKVEGLQLNKWAQKAQLERLGKKDAVYVGRIAAETLAKSNRQHDPTARSTEFAFYDASGALQIRRLDVESEEGSERALRLAGPSTADAHAPTIRLDQADEDDV